ncbi:MAG: outer membrane efflux protein [Ignavibacteria bacterium]|nr:MAG: outer membrane efflux protein [Ignavibacteria bacterium]KAF0160931.1 MAG: outer membrane efflux protein [Ignavibacteria bacterium]
MGNKFFFVLILIVSVVSAQTPELTISLERAIKTALENNHDLKQTKLEKQKADEQVRQTFGEFVLPSIEGSAVYSRALKRSVFFLETPFFSGTFPSGTYNNIIAGVQVDQPIATPSMFLATKISKTYSELAYLVQQYSELELVAKVKDNYYTYLLAKEYVSVAELQFRRAEENLKNTKAMFAVGRVSEYDQIRANVQYQNSIPAVTEAKNQLELAKNNFKLILGLELYAELEISGKLEYNKKGSTPKDTEFQKLKSSNILLKQAETQTKLNELSTDFQHSQHFPELRAFGNWQLQSQENDERSLTNWRFINSVTLGLNLRVPIFKGFSIDSKYQQAKIDYEKSVEVLAKTRKELTGDYENTLASIKKSEDQIASYKSAVEETERGYQIAQKRYSSGLSTQIEITDALVSVSQAKYNYFNSVYVYNILLARMDLLLGKSLDEILNQ